MIKKKNTEQKKLFETELKEIIDLNHPLCVLANEIDWKSLEEKFIPVYSYFKGRPAKEIRLMIGLQYLKYTYNHSDVSVVSTWLENPYWQYFCGEQFFQTKCPINPTMMTKFRKRAEINKLEELLAGTIKSGLKLKVIKKNSLEEVIVDTTVQEKNITFPTDAKLYYKMLTKLTSFAKSKGIKLRQSYKRVAKYSLLMSSRYSHSRKYKKSMREVRKLKTYLGRVYRDIKRKSELIDLLLPDRIKLDSLLEIANRLLNQKRKDKNKIYSIHELDVSCISKGKSHKKYEFGNKSGFVTTSKECFIIGAKAFKGNPYDGHTLKQNIEQTESLTGEKVKDIIADLGYRGHNYDGEAEVHIIRRHRYKDYKMKKRKRQRPAIEPIIGHMKNYRRLGRNYLSGFKGDEINTILSVCGQNMMKLLNAISFDFIEIAKKILQQMYFTKKPTLFQC
jgi:transposase, IS5 family